VPPFWYAEGAWPVRWNRSVVGPAHALAGSTCDGNRWRGLGALGCYWRTMAMVLVEIDLPVGGRAGFVGEPVGLVGLGFRHLAPCV
jgi:hypothetical protein